MRKFYTDDQRLNIFTRVAIAQKQRKSWAEAHEVAKEAGFRGKLPALKVYISRVRKVNRKTVREVDKKVRVENKKFNPAGELENAVEWLVQERVRAAIEKAIEALKSAM